MPRCNVQVELKFLSCSGVAFCTSSYPLTIQNNRSLNETKKKFINKRQHILVRAYAKCNARTTKKFQFHRNIASRHKHVNHFLIYTVSSFYSGVVFKCDIESAKCWTPWRQISVFVVSHVLLHQDFEEKLSQQNKFHYHNVYLLYYFTSRRNFHWKRNNNNENNKIRQQQKNISGLLKLE